MNVTPPYSPRYFAEDHFKTDYRALANVIVELYLPRSVVEFGCGAGDLARELAALSVEVTALDGYSSPEFGAGITFLKRDLNRSLDVAQELAGRNFDVAISLEVAEHLSPDGARSLIAALSAAAPIVIFSAAVPAQDGDGHINLRPREYWHDEFTAQGFVVADRIREKLRPIESLAAWYRLNVIDYVSKRDARAPDAAEVVRRLVASESAATTCYFDEVNRNNTARSILEKPLVRAYFALRRLAKRIVRGET